MVGRETPESYTLYVTSDFRQILETVVVPYQDYQQQHREFAARDCIVEFTSSALVWKSGIPPVEE